MGHAEMWKSCERDAIIPDASEEIMHAANLEAKFADGWHCRARANYWRVGIPQNNIMAPCVHHRL